MGLSAFKDMRTTHREILMEAVVLRRWDMIKYVIESGACAETLDSSTVSPHMIKYCNLIEVVLILESNGGRC